MAKPKRHHVAFTAEKIVEESKEVRFKTKSGKSVDFSAKKPVKAEVKVSFMARDRKHK
jgi:hypothetical protein